MNPAGRGGPGGSSPDPSVRERVLDAFVDLVASRGLAETSVDDVAAKAGVSKTTLYTRWPDRRSLIVDGFRRLAAVVPQPDPEASFPELLGDLFLLATNERVQRRRRQIVAELLAGAGVDDELADVADTTLGEWRVAVRDTIERGKRSGAVPADRDTDAATEVVLAVVLFRQLNRLDMGDDLIEWATRLLTEERPY